MSDSGLSIFDDDEPETGSDADERADSVDGESTQAIPAVDPTPPRTKPATPAPGT